MNLKKSKLYLCLFMSLFIFGMYAEKVSAKIYTNYNGIEMTNQEYNNLLNQGFSENEIYYMNEDTFELNKDITATLVAKTNKYYKTVYTNLNGDTYSQEITKEEYDNQSLMDPRGTVSTEYKNMISTMSRLTNTFRYKVTVGWNRIPSTKSYDIIGVGFDDDVSIASSVYFTYTYTNSDGNSTTSTLHYGKKSTPTGASAVYKIPTNIYGLSAVLYYDVSKNTSSTITSLSMCGDYSHATSNVSSSNYSNHGITYAGITLGANIAYYDAIPCAISSWGGSW